MTVTAIEIASRRPIADGRSLGPFGSYEELRGTLRFAVDPKHPDHQVITDIGLAPTGADGRVAFSSDFLLLKPTQPSPGGSLLYDVVNRGNRTALSTFNDAEGDRAGSVEFPGNAFLFHHGFSVVFCGWQHDVPSGLALHTPEAKEAA